MISLKGNEHKVKILDMGLVMEYMRDGGHKQLARYGFQGTPHYGTMSGLRGYTLSRRDDLEMLGYSIMFLIKEDDIEWLRRDNKEAILQDKIAFAEAQSVKPYFHGIREFIKAAAATDYFVEPDYQKFHELLVHMMDYPKKLKEEAIDMLRNSATNNADKFLNQYAYQRGAQLKFISENLIRKLKEERRSYC